MSFKTTMNEFKEFAVKGNVVDMAVGVIIGGAFGKIVTSLVNDIVMPLIGVLTGGVDFASLYIPLDGSTYATLAEAEEAGAAVLKYGSFISQILDFIIIAFIIFYMIKFLSKLKKEEVKTEEVPTTKVCPYCKSEISIEATRCPNCTSQL